MLKSELSKQQTELDEQKKSTTQIFTSLNVSTPEAVNRLCNYLKKLNGTKIEKFIDENRNYRFIIRTLIK